jgi:hypothetical protein
VLLTAALLWHPPLPGRLPDSAGVADAASADLTRWGLSHVAAALAFGAVAVGFVAVRGHLRERGDGSASAVGLGLVLIGSTLYAVLPGMEFAVVAAHETGADLAQTQAALESWFVPILIVGAVTFAFGTVLVAVAVARGVLRPAPHGHRRRRPGGLRALPGRPGRGRTVPRAVGGGAGGIAAVGRCDRRRATGCRYPLTFAA